MSLAPPILLQAVYWSFAEPVPSSPAALIKAASVYAQEVDCPDPTKQLSSKLPLADLRLRYSHSVRAVSGEWEDKQGELRVVGTEGALTGAELLWELHVACQDTVGRSDQHFFEGLALESEKVGSLPPLYAVTLGS
jgi:hypothetical protein